MSDIDKERRHFFSSIASGASKKLSAIAHKDDAELIIRPPYVKEEALFDQMCPSCQAPCRTVCQEEIIKLTQSQSPYLDFSKSGCTFCDACAVACEALHKDEAVLLLSMASKKIETKIYIDQNSCMAWHHTMCFSCKEPCVDDAIHFEALFKPVIDTQVCTSCGFCVSVCPTHAIKVL